MRRLFLFRPAPGGEASAARARALGLEPVVAPLFEVRPLDWSAPDPALFDAILMTSANAARHGGRTLADLDSLEVHAVGEATAQAARAAGLTVSSVGEGGVDALLAALPPALKLLHLAGEHRTAAAAARQEITAVAVYRAEPLPAPPELTSVGGSVAMLHSPRAARRLAELVDPAQRSTVRIAAISDSTATAAGPGWELVATAATPDDEALLALAARLCEDPRR